MAPLVQRHIQQEKTTSISQTIVRDIIEEDDMCSQINVPTKGHSSREGALKCNKSDTDAFLDFLSSVKPLGSNHWAEVTAKFLVWAV